MAPEQKSADASNADMPKRASFQRKREKVPSLILYKVIPCISKYFIYKDVTSVCNAIKYSPLLTEGQSRVRCSATLGARSTQGPCLVQGRGLPPAWTLISVWAS